MLFLLLSTFIAHTLAKKPRAKHQSMQDPFLSTSQIPGGKTLSQEPLLQSWKPCTVTVVWFGFMNDLGIFRVQRAQEMTPETDVCWDRGGGGVASPAGETSRA